MATQILFLSLVLLSAFPLSFCQFNSQQNIQTFYPFPLPPVGQTPPSPQTKSTSPPPPPTRPAPPLQPPKSSSKGAVAKAVGVTAASTLVLSALFFFLVYMMFSRRKKEKPPNPYSYSRNKLGAPKEFTRFSGKLKGVIVDEDGLDVLYWRNLQGENVKDSFSREVSEKKEEKRAISPEERRQKSQLGIQEVPLPREKSSSSHQFRSEGETRNPGSSIQAISRSPPPPPPPPPPPLPVLPIPKRKSGAPPPPPPPIPSKESPAPPPGPPPPAKGIPSKNITGESSNTGGDGNGQVKLKPLHWDKVNLNVDHSMVWDKIEGGSFRFDDDLMEALFGNVASNRKSPRKKSNTLSPNSERPNPPPQVFILDARKSQNTAIVLRSLAVSRKEIVDALTEGHSLDNDTLEKLTRIAPTKEEESQIVAFDGDPTRLADAESFLFHLLRIVPSAFTRFKALLFRSNYDSEILHLKELLQTLETGCKELRTRGLFLKLLEAILKAGNRMNAGTSRGNAQGFSLSSLRKLSDVKSTDGKTTLLHFVVEGVVRAEGKRCAANTNQSLSRSNGSKKTSEDSTTEEDSEREYKSLGLPIVGGLSAEFSNVKKSATIDYDSFAKSSSVIEAQIAEIVQALTRCGDADGGSFLREMKSFLGEAALEVKKVKEEQVRVMALVKRTTEYYQPGASKEKEKHPLQLFVIVKDFLDMVDQACIDISRTLQKKRSATANVGSSSSSSSPPMISVRFPVLPDHFLSDKSKSSSSDSDDD
ncbi:formin-like protein 4 [Rhododendron vialii]|uniref:formin-like protein 4 n=1 Tax=Rhododendron vialii TaxID=182163 RepID=UPI00265EDA7B|nr:formin-like protein 4 [Rhododendron vialii]